VSRRARLVTRRFLTSRVVRVALVGTALWCGYATCVVYFAPDVIPTPSVIDASVAFALGLLMALRVNRAYERWWEARTLWGTLINASRNLAVKMRVFAQLESAEARRMHTLIAAFAFGLRDQLREGASLASLRGLENEPADPQYVPGWIATQLYATLRDWTKAARISEHQQRMLDLEMRILLEVSGACERIHNTSLPPILTWVTRLAIVGVLTLSAWALRGELGWHLVPLAGFGAFFVLVVETLSHSMEHPFGRDFNQLDLTEMCEVIERSTGEILGVGETAIG
jgi:putative membrane protein